MRRFTRLAAVSAVAALTLTACGGDDGGGAAGGARGFTLAFDGDVDKMNEVSDSPLPDNLRFIFEDTLVTGAFDVEAGSFAMSIGPDDGLFGIRVLEDSFYAKVDLPEMASIDPEAFAGADPADLRSQLDQFGAFLDDELVNLLGAAIDGNWIGVTGIDEEAANDLMADLGVEVPDESEVQDQSAELQAELEGLLTVEDGQIVSDYIELEGDGPTYSATLKARDFVEFVNGLAGELGGVTGMAGAPTEIPASDVPEEIGGIEVTVDGDQVTRISVDFKTLGDSLGEDTEGMAEGDLTLNLEFTEVGDQLSAPGDASTISFDDLASIIEDFAGMMAPAA